MNLLSKPTHVAESMYTEHQLHNLEFSELTSMQKTILTKEKEIKTCYPEAYMYITNGYPSNHLKLRTKDFFQVYCITDAVNCECVRQ